MPDADKCDRRAALLRLITRLRRDCIALGVDRGTVEGADAETLIALHERALHDLMGAPRRAA